MTEEAVNVLPLYNANGSVTIRLTGELAKSIHTASKLRAEATQIEQETLQKYAKTDEGKSLSSLGWGVDGFLTPGKKGSVGFSNFSESCVSVTMIPVRSPILGTTYLDPKVLNNLLNSKLLTDSEKRKLLKTQLKIDLDD